MVLRTCLREVERDSGRQSEQVSRMLIDIQTRLELISLRSRLYNEKAFVLSRGFVRRALEMPLGGLEVILTDIYYTKGRLHQVITKANALVTKSQNAEANDADDSDGEIAVPRLTAGGVLALSRTMTKLEQILSASQPTIN